LSAPIRWALVAPDWEALDTVWKNPLPFVLWPVCGKPLVAHWLEAALHAGAGQIRIYTKDRPHLVRSWILKGDYWSKAIEVVGNTEPEPDWKNHLMDGLPGMGVLPPVQDGRDMLVRWFDLHEPALALRNGSELAIDREISPGVWVGPGASIDPTARLTAPCWIGPQARIGPGCRLGPRAFIGRCAVLDEDVEATNAVVCWDTFVGRHTRLENNAVQGNVLLNWRLGSRSEIEDEFILHDLNDRGLKPGMSERLAALLLFLLLWLPARMGNLLATPSEKNVRIGTSAPLVLKTWPRGPLLFRRMPWLAFIAAGRMKFVGILPRSREEWDSLTPELRSLLERSPAGLFSLADAAGCHDPSDPDEWMHAASQAGAPDGEGSRQARKAALRIALQFPQKP